MQLSGMNPIEYFDANRMLEPPILAAGADNANPAELLTAGPLIERLALAYPYNGAIWQTLGRAKFQAGSYAAAAALR